MFRIAICDDEAILCEQLRDILNRCANVPPLNISIFHDGEELCEAIEHGRWFDLYILDISMDGINGVDAGRKIRELFSDREAAILYISAQTEHSMELFEMQPLNFLQKPLDEEKVYACLRKAIADMQKAEIRFEFYSKKVLHRIEYRRILYFESQDKNILIHTADADYKMLGRISDVMRTDNLPMEFIQVHQSFVVNYGYVEEYRRNQLRLRGGIEIAISLPYRAAVIGRIRTLSRQTREGLR